MKLSEYAKQRGITISLTVVCDIEGYTTVGLNKMHIEERFDQLNEILDDANKKYNSIKLGSDDVNSRPFSCRRDNCFECKNRGDRSGKKLFKHCIKKGLKFNHL